MSPGQLPLEDNCPRRKSPSPLEKIAPWMIAPGLFLLENYHKDNCPQTISLWKLPPRKIAFRMICRLHNRTSDELSRGKLPPPPRIYYARYIFPEESEIAVFSSIVASSCFLSFWFKLVLDFCIRKTL